RVRARAGYCEAVRVRTRSGVRVEDRLAKASRPAVGGVGDDERRASRRLRAKKREQARRSDKKDAPPAHLFGCPLPHDAARANRRTLGLLPFRSRGRRRSSTNARALPCRGRDRRRLPGQLVVEPLPEALGPAFDDLSVADSLVVPLMERHALPSRCYAEVLIRVRALGRGAVRDEVALRQDHVDPHADSREPAADDLENLLERIAISTGIRWSVVLDP